MKLIAILFIVACAPPVGSTSQAMQLPACSVAAPDDGADDTAAVQAAIAARCCLGSGVHDIDTPPQPAQGRRRYDMLTVGAGQELCGSGATQTVLRFRGDAGAQDWRGIEMIGGKLHDLAIDTSALTGTVEQTHAVHVTGPASSIVISDVSINHPIRGTMAGGDCIDLVGYAAVPIVGVVIRDSVLAHCDRGGVQAHSGVRRMTIERVQFQDTGDLDINSEGSGANQDWLISDNTFSASPHNQGSTAIALDLVERARVVGNVMARGVYLYGCKHCAIVGNTIEVGSGSDGAAAIEAIKGSNDLLVADNTIRRMASQPAGHVIHIGPHGTEQSQNVRIVGNVLEQQTTSHVVYIEGLDGLRFDDNAVQYTASTVPAVFGVLALGSGGSYGTPTSHLSLVGNAFSGPLTSSVYVSGSPNRQGIGSLNAAWNTAPSPGLTCGNLDGIAGPLALIYNAWPAGSCGVPSRAVMLP